MINRNNTIYDDVIAERRGIGSFYDSVAFKDEIYGGINDSSLFLSDTLHLSRSSFIVSKIVN